MAFSGLYQLTFRVASKFRSFLIIRKEALLTKGKAVFKICPWIISTPLIGILLPGKPSVTVFTNVKNFRNWSDTAVIYYSVTEPKYFDYTDIVPQPAQKKRQV